LAEKEPAYFQNFFKGKGIMPSLRGLSRNCPGKRPNEILLVLLVSLVIWHRRASLSNRTQRGGGDKRAMCVVGALL
jgi:hypothetical protein